MKVPKVASGARIKRMGSARVSGGRKGGGMGLGKAGALVATPAKDNQLMRRGK